MDAHLEALDDGRDQHGYCPLVEDGTATTCLGLDNGIALEVNDRRVHETSGTGEEGTAPRMLPPVTLWIDRHQDRYNVGRRP